MPQVDLETLVCGGTSNDRKIGCEPPQNPDPQPQNPVISSDDPAESYLVSKEDELDWFDRHAFFDRKGSTKGSDNIPSFVTSSVAVSKRYVVSLKPKASIIGLPKTHDSTFDAKLRRPCKPMNNPRFFPKRSRSSGGKPIVPLSEPGSPKVSCIGRVRSKKDRNRRRRAQLKKEVEIVPVVVAVTKTEKKGLWKVLKSALKIGGGRKIRSGAAVDTVPEQPVPSKRMVTSERYTEPAPPELSGMKRFASGRRSDSWASYDVDLEMEEQISQSPPDSQSGSVWSRRGVGPVGLVSVERQWENAGPASV